jgi:glycosyltransferase involved in cell wall biosynthesis
MNDLPLISIALCTYNGSKYIREQLDSLVSQTYPHKEIIVVDDCSKDNTVEILKEYEAKSLIKLYVNENNLGFVKNFEKAISLCHGEYICLSDQDDIWNLNKIECLYNSIKDSILIYHDSTLIDVEGKPYEKKISDFARFVKGRNNMSFLFMNCASGHAMMFKKELVKHIFPVPESLFHDWWIVYIASTIDKIDFTMETFVKYRQHNSSFTDILKIKEAADVKRKRSEAIATKEQRLESLRKTIQWLDIFYQCSSNKETDRKFIKNLINAYQTKEKALYSFQLLFFLISNFKKLYHIDPNTWKRISFVFKECVGIRLKSGFHSYKNKFLNKFKRSLLFS